MTDRCTVVELSVHLYLAPLQSVVGDSGYRADAAVHLLDALTVGPNWARVNPGNPHTCASPPPLSAIAPGRAQEAAMSGQDRRCSGWASRVPVISSGRRNPLAIVVRYGCYSDIPCPAPRLLFAIESLVSALM
jgi:hypothetical protein